MDKRKRGRLTMRLLLSALLIAVTILTALPLPAAADGPTVPVDLPIRQATAVNPAAKVRAILQGRDAGQLADAVARAGGRVIRDAGLRGAVAVEVPAGAVDQLSREAGVTRVAHDPIMISHGQKDVFDPAKLATVYPWALMSAPLWGEDRVTGRGVGIAIIDSGVAPVPDLGGTEEGSRVIATMRFGASGDNPVENFGHGTAVAGIAGGNGRLSKGKYVGTAPEANIISLKVGDDARGAYASDVIAAIFWAVKHKSDYNIRLINLSLTSTVPESYKTSLLSIAVQYAWFNGIVVVVSAGNYDPATGAPSNVLYPPANDPYVITVGATDDQGTRQTGDDARAYFSRYGATQDGVQKPEIVAPGRRLVTTLSSRDNLLATIIPGRVVDDNYVRLSGTSFSAAAVSGVVAQLLQARPKYRPDEVKWLLAGTANQVAGGAGTGAGYPNTVQAVKYSGPLGLANRGLVPNTLLAKALAKTLFDGVSWDGVSWDGVSWDGVSWDGVSWDGVSWDGVSWDGVSWDGVSWDSISGDRSTDRKTNGKSGDRGNGKVSGNGVSWDGVSWDGVSWDGVSWDGVSWDGVSWDALLN